jgi:hypothetical protein
MSKKEKPLPKPPTAAFGRKKQFGQEEIQGSLLADRMAAAMAEGKLDEFLKQEMPDNEYARNLANMMMGMTGMMPAGGALSSHSPENKEHSTSSENAAPAEILSSEEIPEDVKKAIQGGDVKSLMDLLRREHQKRMPDRETKLDEKAAASPSIDQPTIDKDIIDALIQISKDNNVTMDWIILRAIKVYVEEFRKTGKL